MAVKAMAVSGWRTLPVSLAELSIETTLRSGQTFKWRRLNDEWTSCLYGRMISLKQDQTHLHYRVTWPGVHQSQGGSHEEDDTEELLRNYFSLRVKLTALYEKWSGSDANFRTKAPGFTGVRILNQDAWETLICFICSSNNNISRISQMVHKLCQNYGTLLGHYEDEAMHDFPTPDALTGAEVESRLRELGFGYRAKYIAETARIVAQEKPKHWLESLRNPKVPSYRSPRLPETSHATYKEAQAALLPLSGVGQKVADCVCLMGLGWGESVPVDTHVWQIAQRDYNFGKTKAKTINKVMYDAVGDHFRSIWGEYAGWAHSVLFTADLKDFSDRDVKVKKEIDLEKVVEGSQGSENRITRKRRVVVKREEDVLKPGAASIETAVIEAKDVKRRRTRGRP